MEKLSIFKNIVGNRENKKINLINKPQIHPLHDILHHEERRIEKKDQPKMVDKHGDTQNGDILNVNYQEMAYSDTKLNYPETILPKSIENTNLVESSNHNVLVDKNLPIFKPIIHRSHLPENYLNVLKQNDFEDYYNDENLYDDYMESNSMTSYLIEKVQELHDWVTKDSDFDVIKNSADITKDKKNNFSEVLKALNESLIDGNVTIIMNKLKDIYFGENYTRTNQNRKFLLTNTTNLLSFGILTLDVMLLHNIQLMAWESQVCYCFISCSNSSVNFLYKETNLNIVCGT